VIAEGNTRSRKVWQPVAKVDIILQCAPIILWIRAQRYSEGVCAIFFQNSLRLRLIIPIHYSLVTKITTATTASNAAIAPQLQKKLESLLNFLDVR